jgi:hypothetical protein
MVFLTHATRLEDLGIVGFDEHVAERANLGITENSGRRLHAVERHVTQRTTQSESPVMILSGLSQRLSLDRGPIGYRLSARKGVFNRTAWSGINRESLLSIVN